MAVERAVVWDFDGTLVDTRDKNLRVTRKLVQDVTGRPLAEFPALASPESYGRANRRSVNWRDLFGKEFGLNTRQVDEAGRLWTRYQLADATPAPFFSGIPAAIDSLKVLPQVIFSQNSRDAIRLSLESAGLARYITLIVGYEEVEVERQKPAPDGLLNCLEELGMKRGEVFFVGDHDTDIECARRANAALKRREIALAVVSVGADFDWERRSTWGIRPDHVARRPGDIVRLTGVNGEAVSP